MKDFDWRRKLASRKFWAMLGGQATAVLTAFNAGDSLVMQVAAVIASAGCFAVYMLAEARADAGGKDGAPVEVKIDATRGEDGGGWVDQTG